VKSAVLLLISVRDYEALLRTLAKEISKGEFSCAYGRRDDAAPQAALLLDRRRPVGVQWMWQDEQAH
jgi:hypothetical protein